MGTAGEQLERILYLLPLASREGGVSLTEAAECLGVTVELLQRDLEEITSRAFYHPAGGADEIQILLESNHLKIYSYKKFDRPTKLSGREMLSLALGLRAAASEAEEEASDEILDLAHRIEMELAVCSARGEEHWFEIDEGDHEGATLRTLLKDAARSHTRCRIRYLKPGDRQPEERDVDPYSIVYGSGKWYVIGYCHTRERVLVFRLDRIVEATVTTEAFDAPAGFDPIDYVEGGRVFRSSETEGVYVRYEAAIAPWIRERGPCDDLPGGAVGVNYSAADSGWAVRHVLQHGAKAEVLEPEGVRDMVVASARRVLEASRDG